MKQLPSIFSVKKMKEALDEAARVNQINDLKKQLSDGDYKITKCSEYQLAGKSLPYDIIALNVERDAIRNQLTQLGV